MQTATDAVVFVAATAKLSPQQAHMVTYMWIGQDVTLSLANAGVFSARANTNIAQKSVQAFCNVPKRTPTASTLSANTLTVST